MRTIRGNEIGMIFQEPMTSLNPVFTVGRQLTEGLRVHKGMKREEAEARALDLLRQVRIPEPERRLKQYPHELSGGMRQRVVIAMALACEPRLLIADEPTTALDVTIQAEILALIDRLKRETGAAVLFITHDMAVVAQMADRVVVMYRGRKVEEGHGRRRSSRARSKTTPRRCSRPFRSSARCGARPRPSRCACSARRSTSPVRSRSRTTQDPRGPQPRHAVSGQGRVLPPHRGDGPRGRGRIVRASARARR